MKTLEEQLLESGKFYSENYDVKTFEFIGEHPQYIDALSLERTCRFCGKKSPEVSFRKTAHAISRFLGNKVWLLKNECDTCNEHLFSPMEDDLAKYLQLSLNLGGIRGRNGIPTVKDKATGFRMEHVQDGRIQVTCCQSIINIDKEKKRVTIAPNIGIQKYTPSNVVKAFVKNICSVLDGEEIQKCKKTIQWLVSDSIKLVQFPVLHTFIPGPHPFGNGRLMILTRKTDLSTPYIWGVFEFGNFRYQVMLPFCDEDDFWVQERKPNTFNHFFYPTNTDSKYHETYGSPVFYAKDMSSPEKTTDIIRPMSFSFSKMESIQIDSNEPPVEQHADSEVAYNQQSLLPIYHVSAAFILVVNGEKKHYSGFIGSFSPEEQRIEITSYEIPLHFILTLVNKKGILSFRMSEEVWNSTDIRKVQGIEFIKDFFWASEVSYTIKIDGLQNKTLEFLVPEDFIIKWRDLWTPFMLCYDAANILNILVLYNEYREIKQQIDLVTLRDFVTFYQNKCLDLEHVILCVSSVNALCHISEESTEFLIQRFFMLMKYRITFQTRFVGRFKITEEMHDNNENEKSYTIESTGPVKAEYVDYSITDNDEKMAPNQRTKENLS